MTEIKRLLDKQITRISELPDEELIGIMSDLERAYTHFLVEFALRNKHEEEPTRQRVGFVRNFLNRV